MSTGQSRLRAVGHVQRASSASESFDPFALIDVKKLRPEICRGQLSMNFEKDKAGLPWYKRFIAGNLLLNFDRPDFIAYKFEDRKGYCLRACVRTWGAQEVSWTIHKRGPARLRGRRQHPHLRTLRPGRTVKNWPPQLVEAGSFTVFRFSRFGLDTGGSAPARASGPRLLGERGASSWRPARSARRPDG